MLSCLVMKSGLVELIWKNCIFCFTTAEALKVLAENCNIIYISSVKWPFIYLRQWFIVCSHWVWHSLPFSFTQLLTQTEFEEWLSIHQTVWPGPHLNIKTIFPRYEDSHVKDKISLTWEFLYWKDWISILRQVPVRCSFISLFCICMQTVHQFYYILGWLIMGHWHSWSNYWTCSGEWPQVSVCSKFKNCIHIYGALGKDRISLIFCYYNVPNVSHVFSFDLSCSSG